MKSKILKSILTPILGLSAIGTIAITSTSCSGNKQKIEPDLDKTSLDLSIGNNDILKVLGVVEGSITWKSSDVSIATVKKLDSNSAEVIANSEGKEGKVEVTATVNRVGIVKNLICKVNVRIVSIKSIKIKPSVANISINGSLANFTIECTPTNASIQNVRIQSSNRRIANPISSGDKLTTFQVEGLNEGDATITAYVTDYNGKQESATCKVNVGEGVPAEKVTLDKHQLYIPQNKTDMLYATILPTNSTDKLYWESNDPSIAMVDQLGRVTGVSEGSTVIIVSSASNPNVYDTCNVTISESTDKIHVDYIRITNPWNVNLIANDDIEIMPTTIDAKTYELDVAVYPENAFNKTVTWKSSDESIATVDKNGKITAIAPGKVTITVQSNDNAGAIDECDVTILGFEMSNDDLELAVNDTHKMYVKVLPESESESSSINFIWSSNNKRMATVDNFGTITAINEGNVDIIASSSLISKGDDSFFVTLKCHLTIVFEPVMSISIENTDIVLTPDSNQGKFIVKFNPTNASNKKLKWTSSNESIVTVDDNGCVTAVGKNGIVAVTAVSDDKPSAIVTGRVHVINFVE